MPADDDAVSPRELRRFMERIEREVTDIRREIPTATQPLVRQDVWEENRRAVGERIGEIEADVREQKATMSAINRIAWTAIIMGILIPLFVAALFASLGLR